VLGLNGVPEAGWEFSSVEDEKAARELAEERAMQAKSRGFGKPQKGHAGKSFRVARSGAKQGAARRRQGRHPGLGRGDCRGAQENRIGKVSLEMLHSDVGTITENDVALASASKAVILGFHTRVDSTAAKSQARRRANQALRHHLRID
jgi:translation initiation factor IF-2